MSLGDANANANANHLQHPLSRPASPLFSLLPDRWLNLPFDRAHQELPELGDPSRQPGLGFLRTVLSLCVLPPPPFLPVSVLLPPSYPGSDSERRAVQ